MIFIVIENLEIDLLMANRVLRDWTTSEKIDALSEGGELFFVRLIMKADDHGCFHANPKLLKAALFPLKDYTSKQMDIWVRELEQAGIIQTYRVDSRDYLRINDFGHRLRNMVSKFPQPADNPPSIDSNEPPETKRNEVETENEGEITDAGKPATIDDRAKLFMEKIAIHLDTYPKDMLRDFYDYWTETNEGGRKMRFEMQKVFDMKRRLKTWDNNNKKSINGTSKKQQHTDDLIKGFAERVIARDKGEEI
jgi:hypothetical protein